MAFLGCWILPNWTRWGRTELEDCHIGIDFLLGLGVRIWNRMVLSDNIESSRLVCQRASDLALSNHIKHQWLRIHFTPVSISYLALEDEARGIRYLTMSPWLEIVKIKNFMPCISKF